MSVHEVAQQGFGSQSVAYERTRPSYPPAAVAWLVEHLGAGAGTRLVDLASGTGKLTSLLVPTQATVIAVEPVEGMRRRLVDTLPAVPLVAGTAERLPFADASLDAVAVAQAFHWFDTHVAFAELARVLRRGGRLGLVWNRRDRSAAWVDELWKIVDPLEAPASWSVHHTPSRDAAFAHDAFTTPEGATFGHEQVLTPDGVVDRVASVSHVAALAVAEREAVLGRVRLLLATHPDARGATKLTIPYRVDACWYERR